MSALPRRENPNLMRNEHLRAQGRKAAAKFRERHYARSLELARNAYYNHREKRLAGVKTRIARNRAAIDILKAKPCLDCGVKYPSCVMEFDHVRGTKSATVGRMMSRDQGLKAIMAEIAKCDLVCANCHRIRTYLSGRVIKSGRPRKWAPVPGQGG